MDGWGRCALIRTLMVAPAATLYDVPAGLCVTLHEPHAGAASERFAFVVPRKREEGEAEAAEADEVEEVGEVVEVDDAVEDT